MWASGIVESDVVPKRSTGLWHAGVCVQIDLLIFDRPPKALDEDVVPALAPFPSMLIFTSAPARILMNSTEVNWLP